MSRMKSTIRALLFSLCSFACDGGESSNEVSSEPQLDAVLDCAAKMLEDDLVYSGPLVGAGIDASSGELGPLAAGQTYIVSTTYLALRPEAQQQFQELMAPLLQQLPTQPGLLAYQFASSERCGTARTFAVWRDEEAMFGFVTSPAHALAMRKQPEVSKPISTTASYVAHAESEVTLERAVRELE